MGCSQKVSFGIVRMGHGQKVNFSIVRMGCGSIKIVQHALNGIKKKN
jgi:hypothetical protein